MVPLAVRDVDQEVHHEKDGEEDVDDGDGGVGVLVSNQEPEDCSVGDADHEVVPAGEVVVEFSLKLSELGWVCEGKEAHHGHREPEADHCQEETDSF